jgi:membrane-associated protease RseP (regulator of RpoE activity)
MMGISHVLDSEPARSITEFFYTTPDEFGEPVVLFPRLLQLWRGYPYALSIMLILGAHELGHYFAARYHNQAASLPYFIPLPFGIIGTMGAFIRLREPMRNRKVLMDIGAAGPLMGLVFAIPILLIGLMTSDVQTVNSPGMLEGNSILYAMFKVITKGQFLPNGTEDVFVNQMAWAGWIGLLITSLNLIPVGQLDGGHIMYSLLGDRARVLYYPIVGVMVVLAIISQVWVLWVVLLMLFGRLYAAPLDDITPLDPPRRFVAFLAFAMLILTFVPRPLTENGFIPASPDGEQETGTTVQTFIAPANVPVLVLEEYTP